LTDLIHVFVCKGDCMNAMVMESAGSAVAPEDRQRPEPSVNEVLIRFRACGVCHSDLAV
jgi:D-arabinose 1-dehydrogenase-like Zn-dependent alcohol dehydrogenase